jgi:hypothetical protein
MGFVKDKGDEELYDRLDSAYLTDDDADDTEVYAYLIFYVCIFFLLNLLFNTLRSHRLL